MNPYKTFRNFKNLTQDELALILGVSRPYVSMIENGKRVPSPELRLKISKALGVPVEVLKNGAMMEISLQGL